MIEYQRAFEKQREIPNVIVHASGLSFPYLAG